MLTELLADADDNKANPIPIAIETPRGLLVAALRATGRQVYAIQPDGGGPLPRTVAHSKSDHADAMVLANILRTDRPRTIACPRIANSPKRRGARADATRHWPPSRRHQPPASTSR
jgi:hypothetical protein